MTINHKSRLLVVAPHNDDEAIGCGGLIGKCIKENSKVLVIFVCIGKSRQFVIKKTDGKSRMREIEKAKKFAGFQVKVLYVGNEFCRLDTIPQKELIEQFEDIVESFKPSIIALPSSSSYNQDHRAVFDACIAALRPMTKSIRHFVPHVLECFEPYFWSAKPLKQPNAYLDLNEQYKEQTLLNFKINLYKCHITQIRSDPFPRSPENLIRMAQIYGKEIGVEIAEAYHLLRTELC